MFRIDASHTAWVCLFHMSRIWGIGYGMSVTDPLCRLPQGGGIKQVTWRLSLRSLVLRGVVEWRFMHALQFLEPFHTVHRCFSRGPDCTCTLLSLQVLPYLMETFIAFRLDNNREPPFICTGAPSTSLMMRTTYSAVRYGWSPINSYAVGQNRITLQ